MDYTKKHILKILRNRAFCQRTAEYISPHYDKCTQILAEIDVFHVSKVI